MATNEVEDSAGVFRYVDTPGLQCKESELKDNYIREKLPSEKGIPLASVSTTFLNEGRFPDGQNTEDVKELSSCDLRNVVHRLIVLVLILTVVSIAALVLSLLVVMGVVGSAKNITTTASKEPSREMMKSIQEVKADMAGFQGILNESVQKIKTEVENSTEMLTTKLDLWKNENRKVKISCDSSQRQINQIGRQLKMQGMNFSGSGLYDFETDTAKLWTEVNITRKKLEAKTEDLQEAAERSKTNFTEMYLRFSRLSTTMNGIKQSLQDGAVTCSSKLASVNTTLMKQIAEVSKMPGPIGPPGNNGLQGSAGTPGTAGPPGPAGNGDFSQCQHNSVGSTSISSGPAVQSSKVVIEAKDKRIVGATCSTDDAKEYRLSSKIVPAGSNKGQRMYTCDCAGQADVLRSSDGRMKCILHYWECPLVT